MFLRRSADEQVLVSDPVCHNGGIEHLSARTALPGVIRADEIIKFFCEHFTFASGAFHGESSYIYEVKKMLSMNSSLVLHNPCQSTPILLFEEKTLQN
jgi:hypothetical protein